MISHVTTMMLSSHTKATWLLKKKKKTIQEPHDEGIGGAHVIYMP